MCITVIGQAILELKMNKGILKPVEKYRFPTSRTPQ